MKQQSATNYFHMFKSLLLAQDVKGCSITIIGENGERLQKGLKWVSQRRKEPRRKVKQR